MDSSHHILCETHGQLESSRQVCLCASITEIKDSTDGKITSRERDISGEKCALYGENKSYRLTGKQNWRKQRNFWLRLL